MAKNSIEKALNEINREQAAVEEGIVQMRKQLHALEKRHKQLDEAKAALSPLSEAPAPVIPNQAQISRIGSLKAGAQGGARRSCTPKEEVQANIEKLLRATPDKWFTAREIHTALTKSDQQTPGIVQFNRFIMEFRGSLEWMRIYTVKNRHWYSLSLNSGGSAGPRPGA